MSVRRGTVHSIQFLRFVAASLVVMFHTQLAFAEHTEYGVPAAQSYLFGFGAVGVHIFFVISGYIMYLTNFGRGDAYNPAKFYARRLIRIYPVYWVFVGLYVAGETLIGNGYRLDAGEVAGMLALWPGYASKVIGPAWTLTFELYFYVAFGLVMTLGARLGAWVLTAFFCACVVAKLYFGAYNTLLWLMSDPLLLEFVAGVWIARITGMRGAPRWLGVAAVILAVAGYGAGFAIGYANLPSALVWGAPSALLVLGFVVLDQAGGIPGIRRLSVLGDSSYSLYLCHILLIDLVVAALAAAGLDWPVLLGTALVVPLAIGFAHGFFLTIERPMVQRLHRLTERRRPPAPASVAPSGGIV